MKIISVKLQNFGSYKELEFPINNNGLTLIQGPTGAGKSTLCDAIPWILFGVTAKGGKVDDIRNWNSKEDTIGTLAVITAAQHHIIITRIRGRTNDLYFQPPGDAPKRGRDLADTQRMVCELLGLGDDLYLAGAYFHEFSQTASFFTTTAKNRRTICENLVDLSLAKKLSLKATEAQKTISKTIDGYNTQINIAKTKITILNTQLTKTKQLEERWAADYALKLQNVEAKFLNFAKDQQTLITKLQDQHNKFEGNRLSRMQQLEDKILAAEALIRPHTHPDEETCKECGQMKESVIRAQVESENARRRFSELSNQLTQVKLEESPYASQLDIETKRVNTHNDHLEFLKAQSNPHSSAKLSTLKEHSEANVELIVLEETLKEHQLEAADWQQLQEVTAAFRSALIQTTINRVQSSTNTRLEKHFDSELRVTFEVQDADKLEVTIYKDGNICSYPQLSKGQRQILKLCFGVAIMETIQEHHGIKFNCVFFDEATDGCDDSVKIKAINMLQTLPYDNTFVVEHSPAAKAMIDNKITVSLVDGNSVLE